MIGLAPNLFYGTGLAACVLILRANKPAERKDKILFINAEALFRAGRNQNTLEAAHTAEILNLYRGYADVTGKAAVVKRETINTNGGNLNIPLYVEPADTGTALTLPDALKQLEQARAAAAKSRAALDTQLEAWGL